MGSIGPGRSSYRVGLAAKLALLLVTAAVGLVCLAGYLNYRDDRRKHEQMVLLSAERVSDIIRRSAQYSMMRNDREALHQLIRDIGGEPGMRRIRIFNKEGEIQYSTDQAEVGRMVDKQAEQCFACHSQGRPLARLERRDRARVFADETGRRTLAVVLPVENEPSCSNAACHAHPADQKILGVIDTHMALDRVDEIMAEKAYRLILYSGIAVVLLIVLSILFIWVVVHRPLKALSEGARRVASGDLSYRIPVLSNDELGDLAAEFNHMTDHLERAQAELRSWAQTLQERVQQKTAELERAQGILIANEKMASLGKLAATVAHEVNNPLFGILTYAKLSRKDLRNLNADGSVRERMDEHLSIIERESKRCGEIMRDLLTFSRQSPPQRVEITPAALVRRALNLVRHKAELQQVDVQVDVAEDLPPLACDPNQIQQVLLVLMVNATEAMPKGGLLKVTAEATEDEKGMRFRVADTGCGIPPEVLPQIFEPFFTTKSSQHRTGLGLAIARGIVERHGGSISVESRPGEGTVFTVALPREAPGFSAPPEEQSSQFGPTAPHPEGMTAA